MEKYVIGIDLGGTQIKIGIVDNKGNVISNIESIPTQVEKGPGEAIDRVCNHISYMIEKTGIKKSNLLGIGIASPGPIDLKNGKILSASNLPSWENYPIRKRFINNLGLPAVLDKDSNAAILGEYCFGVAKGYQNVVCLTLGTGIGGSVIVNGRILHGADGVAGELGHITIVPENGRKCGCNNEGCLEAYVGTQGIISRTLEKLKQDSNSLLKKYIEINNTLSPEDIYETALAGDHTARFIWEETGRYLGIALAGFINIFNPEIVVLCGGISRAECFLIPSIQQELEKRAFKKSAKRIQLKVSELGGAAGVIGAASIFLTQNKVKRKKSKRKALPSLQKKYILSIHIGATGTRMAILDISNNEISISSKVSLTEQGKDRNEIIQIVREQARDVIKTSGIRKSEILGTGITTPGPLDIHTKVIYDPPHLEWAYITVEREFNKYLPKPIYIDKDADAAALAELQFGKGRNVKNFLCVEICTGIGAGIIINNEIYRGSTGLAGEIGHQTIVDNGLLCQCGKKGCLESYASGIAIIERMKEHIINGETKLSFTGNDISYMDICNAADKGDKLSIHLLEQMGKYMGIGIANVINIFNPSKIIISGRLVKAYKHFISNMQKEIENRTFHAALPISIEATDFGENADLIGAAATFLYQINYKE
jgi:glucokinase